MFDQVAVVPARHPRELLALTLAHLAVLTLGLGLWTLSRQEMLPEILPEVPIEVPFELRAPASAAGSAASGPAASKPRPAPRRPAPATPKLTPAPPDPAPSTPAVVLSVDPAAAPPETSRLPDGGPGVGSGQGTGPGDQPGLGRGDGLGDGEADSDGTLTLDAGAVRVRSQREPVYPPAAAALGIEASTCTVQIEIDPRGVPSAVTPVSCLPAFIEPTVDAAMKWRFYPVRIDGEAVPARFVLRVNYRLR